MSQVVSTCSSLDHPCIEGLIVINAKREQKLALFTQKSYSPTNLSNIYFSPPRVNSKQRAVTGPPTLWCWGGEGGGNAKTCWDGPDKMPTKKLIRTKCQPQKKKSRTKCQPRLAFCPVGILSYHLSYNHCIECTFSRFDLDHFLGLLQPLHWKHVIIIGSGCVGWTGWTGPTRLRGQRLGLHGVKQLQPGK